MKAVAVRELKDRLSAYLREVAAGEVVLVTDRGRVVADCGGPASRACRARRSRHWGASWPPECSRSDCRRDPAAYRRPGVRISGSSQALLDAERGKR